MRFQQLKRAVLRGLARRLRRLADALSTPADNEPGIQTLRDENDPSPSSPDRARPDRNVPGHPPAHWLERVRRMAPEMIRNLADSGEEAGSPISKDDTRESNLRRPEVQPPQEGGEPSPVPSKAKAESPSPRLQPTVSIREGPEVAAHPPKKARPETSRVSASRKAPRISITELAGPPERRSIGGTPPEKVIQHQHPPPTAHLAQKAMPPPTAPREPPPEPEKHAGKPSLAASSLQRSAESTVGEKSQRISTDELPETEVGPSLERSEYDSHHHSHYDGGTVWSVADDNAPATDSPKDMVTDEGPESATRIRLEWFRNDEPGLESSAAVQPVSADRLESTPFLKGPGPGDLIGDDEGFVRRDVLPDGEGGVVEGKPQWPELPAVWSSADTGDEMLAALRRRDHLRRIEIEQEGNVWSG